MKKLLAIAISLILVTCSFALIANAEEESTHPIANEVWLDNSADEVVIRASDDISELFDGEKVFNSENMNNFDLEGIVLFQNQLWGEAQSYNEIELVIDKCKALGVNVVLSTVWAEGGKGGMALAEEVVKLCEEPNDFSFSYELDGTIYDKIEAIVRRIYGGDGVNFAPAAKKEIDKLTALGYGGLPVCMAKTQYSFSDDQTKLGAPEGFKVTVRNVKVSAGAGFIVALTGDIMTMPGLPKSPAAERIDVDENGRISGLF